MTDTKAKIETRNEQADASRYEMIERLVEGSPDGIRLATGYKVVDPLTRLYWVSDEGGAWEAESTTLADALLQAYQMWEEQEQG